MYNFRLRNVISKSVLNENSDSHLPNKGMKCKEENIKETSKIVEGNDKVSDKSLENETCFYCRRYRSIIQLLKASIREMHSKMITLEGRICNLKTECKKQSIELLNEHNNFDNALKCNSSMKSSDYRKIRSLQEQVNLLKMICKSQHLFIREAFKNNINESTVFEKIDAEYVKAFDSNEILRFQMYECRESMSLTNNSHSNLCTMKREWETEAICRINDSIDKNNKVCQTDEIGNSEMNIMSMDLDIANNWLPSSFNEKKSMFIQTPMVAGNIMAYDIINLNYLLALEKENINHGSSKVRQEVNLESDDINNHGNCSISQNMTKCFLKNEDFQNIECNNCDKNNGNISLVDDKEKMHQCWEDVVDYDHSADLEMNKSLCNNLKTCTVNFELDDLMDCDDRKPKENKDELNESILKVVDDNHLSDNLILKTESLVSSCPSNLNVESARQHFKLCPVDIDIDTLAKECKEKQLHYRDNKINQDTLLINKIELSTTDTNENAFQCMKKTRKGNRYFDTSGQNIRKKSNTNDKLLKVICFNNKKGSKKRRAAECKATGGIISEKESLSKRILRDWNRFELPISKQRTQSPEIEPVIDLTKESSKDNLNDLLEKCEKSDPQNLSSLVTSYLSFTSCKEADSYLSEILQYMRAGADRTCNRSSIAKMCHIFLIKIFCKYPNIHINYYRRSMDMIRDGNFNVMCLLVAVNMSVYVSLKQVKIIITFVTDLILYPNVPILLAIKNIKPSVIFTGSIIKEYRPWIEIIRRIVVHEYCSVTNSSLREIIDTMKRRDQQFWLGCKTINSEYPTVDFKSLMCDIREICNKYPNERFLAMASNLDGQLQKKYNKFGF